MDNMTAERFVEIREMLKENAPGARPSE